MLLFDEDYEEYASESSDVQNTVIGRETMQSQRLYDKVTITRNSNKYTGAITKLTTEGIEIQLRKFTNCFIKWSEVQEVTQVYENSYSSPTRDSSIFNEEQIKAINEIFDKRHQLLNQIIKRANTRDGKGIHEITLEIRSLCDKLEDTCTIEQI